MTRAKNHAYIQVYGSLADFLKSAAKKSGFKTEFELNPSAKDLIEAQGIPHVEVGALKVNGETKSLNYNVQPGDRLEVFPRSRPDAPDGKSRAVRFIADVHLGKLTRLLRLAGFDVKYKNDLDDRQIVARAVGEDRTVLTRDRELLKHGELKEGYWLRSTDPNRQAVEVLKYYNLGDKTSPFTRCLECNGTLSPADLEEVSDRVPEQVRTWCHDYVQCDRCSKVYWKGSHYENLKKKVDELLTRL